MDVSGQWRYTRGFVRGFVSGLRSPQAVAAPTPDLDDPEVLLSLAQQEMRETQAKNRERAVQAITQKNNLQAEVDKTARFVRNLQAKAELAHREGDFIRETQLLVEKGAYQQTLVKMETSLAFAVQMIETIKTRMRQEEERIRAKTAQAMALKTQWKQSQIMGTLDLTLTVEDDVILKPVRHEIRAYLAQARRLSDEISQMAERALRNGNRPLARALLTERAALLNAPSTN